MKKYSLGIIAVALVIGISAFSTLKKVQPKPLTTYYWFQVNSMQGDDNSLDNSQVVYLEAGTTISQGPCAGSGHNCRVGFTSDQVQVVEGSVYELKNTPQTISTVGQTRSTQ